jgi:hypothetical protein
VQPDWLHSIIHGMGLFRTLKQILMELAQAREVNTPSNVSLERRSPKPVCDQTPRPIGTVLSPAQRQYLLQVINQKLASEKGNAAVNS